MTSATCFIMAGAVPQHPMARRLPGARYKGFLKTGPDLSQDELTSAGWPLARPPFLLETSRPGIFAVGDVRGGNFKRVASAVGEGSNASRSSINCFVTDAVPAAP